MSKAYGSRSLGVFGVAATAALYLAATSFAFADPVTPNGIWYTKDDESIIKVQPCKGKPDAFCGILVWLKEPNEANGSPKLDTQNPDPTKKTQSMVGLEILRGMVVDDDHWSGQAYNPDNGKLYDITFKVKTDKIENDQADLRGCILGFLCQTETFNRAKEVPGGEPASLSGDTPVKKHKGAKKASVAQ